MADGISLPEKILKIMQLPVFESAQKENILHKMPYQHGEGKILIYILKVNL
jgi:hypothetical protein